MNRQVNNKLIAMTPEEIAADQAAKAINPDRIKTQLHQACERYQHGKTLGDCDSNFFSMLIAGRTIAKITAQPLPAKTAACLAWLDSLWSEYDSRKANNDPNFDFSSFGSIPHSFDEVRAELEA